MRYVRQNWPRKWKIWLLPVFGVATGIYSERPDEVTQNGEVEQLRTKGFTMTQDDAAKSAPTLGSPCLVPYYQRDGITLYHCDALEVLPALRFDLMLTDPPYGIALENHARGKSRSDTDWTIANDDTQETGQAVLDASDGATIAFSSPMKPWAGKWRQYLVWEKGEHVGGGGDPATCWKPTYEMIQVRNTGPLDGRRDGAVLRFRANQADYRFHPTPKPIALIEYLLCKLRPTRVCDPFSGGGSTLVAAKLCGVEAVGVEIDKRHCQTIVRRLSQGVLF